ncbi:MAG: CAP domain-containing protein [Bacteroidales bacterium]|nr:CAP domain-containing protein [Bacteroidales bacterium]
MKTKAGITLLLLMFYFVTAFSQTKVQKLYDAKKYEKCLILCDKNIKENKDKQGSILYKSLVLTDAFRDEKIIKLYEYSIYESLKGISKLESYNKKKPKDSFYRTNKRKIKRIKDNVLVAADSFFIKGNSKRAKKIYKKLMQIYPAEKVYLFKLAKAYNFKSRDILKNTPNIDEADLHETIYDVVSESFIYLKKGGRGELENALETLFLQEKCDIETASTLLVFLKRNYKSSTKAKELSRKFQEKYWQIDLLVMVNKKRATGYICGEKSIKKQLPLVLCNCLVKTAQKYADTMKKEDHYSHYGPDGKSPWERARDEGCYSDGENIAAGYANVSEVLGGWLQSPGHCKNIMGNHKYMGIGHSGTYWVQMFR